MVTKKEMNATADPMYKGNLQATCGELESGEFSKKKLDSILHSGQVALKFRLPAAVGGGHACRGSLVYDLVSS